MRTSINEDAAAVELSIVTTMYCSANFVDEFYRLSSKAAESVASSYEIIFVNDGSPDDALDRARNLVEIDSHVRVVDLSRNFGHHRAIMVGLEYARGCHIFLIDCDLEEDPLSLPKFFAEMRETQSDVVYGVQRNRKGTFVRRWGGACFWFLFNLISDVPITPNVITSRLMTRRYVDALLGFREQELFLAGIFDLAGFKQIPMLIDKGVRANSSYTIFKRISLMVNATTSFSSKPLVIVFYIGLAISIIAGTAAAILIAKWFALGGYQLGWPSVVISIWLIGGITIFCLGLVGIYLAKVFHEVKNRPLSIVRGLYEQQNKD